MLTLTRSSLKDTAEWQKTGTTLPQFDIELMKKNTAEAPEWIHFGAGNIFRGFIAPLQQKLLEQNLAKTGIIAADTFDGEIIEKIYKPFDNLALLVTMCADGSLEKSVIASAAEAYQATPQNQAHWARLKAIFASSSLKMVSFTITEKGYALRGMNGEILPVVQKDFAEGPSAPVHAMSIITALMLERFNAGAKPIALVSMDNCSQNGEKLQSAVLETAEVWLKNGFVPKEFVSYLKDTSKVAFPWTMIDKITPRPAKNVQEQLEKDGISNIAPITTSKGTFIAPFVNAEKPQYLVIEDTFPAGRPAFENLKDSGVFLTDRASVSKSERMKVTACLNPLHTALAVYGCILGYTSIAEEMKNPLLVSLIKQIGYKEGLPVVEDPGILSPKAFIDEVINGRLVNPNIPDTPQRIATDTSQKIPVRFGETIKSYIQQGKDLATLKGIPLAIAGWLRYLLAVDSKGRSFEPSSDPMLKEMQEKLKNVKLGDRKTVNGVLEPILANETLFGTDLTKTPLAAKITAIFEDLTADASAVETVLQKYL
ncbi:MAG: mannitol dehydrogenase family protein [Spirochaetaceae bacterium]|nr:mannitol dehydrogenase family protein [Spirochaetaceae bacterium]